MGGACGQHSADYLTVQIQESIPSCICGSIDKILCLTQMSNMWVAVYEERTADYLTERNIPCFDARQMLEVDPECAFATKSGLAIKQDW